MISPARTPAVARAPRVLAVAAAVLLLLLTSLAGATRATADEDTTPDTPLVVAGVAGLQWSDVDPGRTPNLWRLIGGGSVASVAVRTLTPTCPLDAWLTFSAGAKVVAQGDDDPAATVDGEDAGQDVGAEDEPADPQEGDAARGCPTLPSPATTQGTVGAAHVPGWSGLTTADPVLPATAEPGALGDLAGVAGTCATAVGSGAAVALADTHGNVPRYLSDPGQLTAEHVAACPATVVDLGVLPDAAGERSAAVQELDAEVGRLSQLLPGGGRFVVAGVSDTPLGPSDLQVVVDWTAPGGRATWLTSTSSRWVGVVVLADLSATVADAVTGGALSGTAPEDEEPEEADGADEDAAPDPLTEALAPFTGSPLERGDDRRISVARTVENRQYLSVLTDTVPRLSPLLVGLVVVADIAVVGALLLARRRTRSAGVPGAHRAADAPSRPQHGRRIGTALLVVASSLPVAASLATLSRWWAWPSHVMTLVLSLAVAALVAALVAWAARRLLPPSPWRLTTCLAGITWLVLTVDGLTGTTLQQGSLLGPAPSLGARFYGFSNTVFAVYAVAGIVLAAGLAALLRARGRGRVPAAWAAGAVGVVTVLVDGLPPFGADLGGILALVPGFAVLVLGIAGVRVTWRRALLVGAATVAVVAVIAVVDWMLDGAGSHLGGFVQSVLDGRAISVVAGKAAGAWATVANPAGAVALLVCGAAAWALLAPDRARLDAVAEAYRRDALVHRLVVSLVVTAAVGTLLNDSGIAVAFLVLVLSLPVVLAGHLAHAAEQERAPADHEPGIRRMPTILATVSGTALVVLLLASSVMSAAGLRSESDVAQAGSQVNPTRADTVATETPLVVVGTTGVRWDDVAEGRAPALHRLLADGAGAGGVAQPTGSASRCTVGGWLALSAGTLTEVATDRAPDDSWACPSPQPDPVGDGATVAGWQELVDLQQGSTYQARLGSLGSQLAPAACTTAVGPGAALALAGPDGDVARYRELDAALAPGSDAYSCPITVVDAGDATPPAVDPELPADEAKEAREDRHADRLRAVDDTVRRVLTATPDDATVLVVDVAGTPGTRPVLGVALARPASGGPDQPRYLTSAATRTDGVARVLDVPATVLGAAGITPSAPVQNTPFAWGSPRPPDSASSATDLADLTALDHVRRTVYTSFVDVPLYAGLALAGACLLLGPRSARARTARAQARWRTAWGWARGAALVLAAMPSAAFLVSLTGWWRFEQPMLAVVASTVGATAVVAALGALAPRRPVWLGPGILAGIAFAVLTLDAFIGTPLNRASPLGSAPTFGARFYGFGNPTFSVYAVAALVVAAALAQWLVRRGRRGVAAATVGAVGLVTMAVDVWPTLGADLGGGLVVVPAFAVLGLAASGARLTWRRFFGVAAVGVAAVAVVGVLDWLRPADQRSHLGLFVGQAIEGEAWETLWRKAGYAARSVLGGVPVWLTLVVLAACALLLFAPRRFTPRWFARTEEEWPLLRPTVLALWIVCVAGSVVNDFGARIAVIALVPAVPLLTVAVLHARWPEPYSTSVDSAGDAAGDSAEDSASSAARPGSLPGR